VSRFVIEIFRGDERGVLSGGLSTSQFISLILLPLSLVMLYVLSRRPDVAPKASANRARRA
jgi:prolipoprotein diacylglyceryltransferase